jgi:hypothetical protein
MTWRGRLKHVDVGTGAWTLETQGGDRLALYGDVPRELDGQSVVVEGEQVEAMGIGMVGGPAVHVRSVKARRG